MVDFRAVIRRRSVGTAESGKNKVPQIGQNGKRFGYAHSFASSASNVNKEGMNESREKVSNKPANKNYEMIVQ